MEHLFVEDIMLLFFHQKANLMLAVDGQVLMSYPNAIKRLPDPDGIRTEIQCANCGGNLGHEFVGEGFTETLDIVSLSIRFIPKTKELPKIINEE